MVTEAITTTQDDNVKTLEEQLAELQAKVSEAKAAQAAEAAEVLNQRRADIINGISDLNELGNPDSEAWEAINAAECVSFVITLIPGADGEPPILSKSLTPKAATKTRKASSDGGTGTRRNLEEMFRTVASPEQIAWFEANKAEGKVEGNKDQRGKRHGFMEKVTSSDDPQSVEIPS